MKVLIVIDMEDEEFNELNKRNKEEMIIDIGHDYDKENGWAFLRKRLLSIIPISDKPKILPMTKLKDIDIKASIRVSEEIYKTIDELLGDK